MGQYIAQDHAEYSECQRFGDKQKRYIELFKNDELKQIGNTSQMIFPPGELLVYISTIFTLEIGDIILTGTPAGVGPIYSGDNILAKIDKVGSINFDVE